MEKNKNNHIVNIILIAVIILLSCFIIYDKFLGEKDNKKNEHTVEEVEKVNYNDFSISTEVPLVCTIDMTNLTEINITEKCGDDFDIKNKSYQIRVNNIAYKDATYSFTYILEKNTFAPSDDDVGIVKMYIGSTLADAFDGEMREIFSSIKVDGDQLYVSSSTRSDVPKYETYIDVSKIVK